MSPEKGTIGPKGKQDAEVVWTPQPGCKTSETLVLKVCVLFVCLFVCVVGGSWLLNFACKHQLLSVVWAEKKERQCFEFAWELIHRALNVFSST